MSCEKIKKIVFSEARPLAFKRARDPWKYYTRYLQREVNSAEDHRQAHYLQKIKRPTQWQLPFQQTIRKILYITTNCSGMFLTVIEICLISQQYILSVH